MKPTRALGTSCRIDGSIPNPARNTGTNTTSRFNWAPRALASGVVTDTAFVSNERVASYTINVATSARQRRNSSGLVRRSRRRVRLCCTNGCAMTVTWFTLPQKARREIIQAGLQLRKLETQVHLDA